MTRVSPARSPERGLRRWVLLQIVWFGMVCLLVYWWAHLIGRQADRIADLETQLGLSSGASAVHVARMVRWEGAGFVALLATSLFLLIWMVYRDVRRGRAIQAFFASVTHELRTPLTGIRLQAEALADGQAQTHPHLIERLLEDTQRLEGEVERMLELARLEGGGRLNVRPVRVRSWLDRTLSSWDARYPKDRIEVVTTVPDGEWVEADPAALQVILRNLLENSIRHAKKIPVQVRVSTERQRGHIWLRVTDDGAGSDVESIRRLGMPFEKGVSSQGAGIGLYLSRLLMERMGGVARFASAEPHGFEVRLGFKEARADG